MPNTNINELKVGNRCALKNPARSCKYVYRNNDLKICWEYRIGIEDDWMGFEVLFTNKDYVLAYDRAYNLNIILNYSEHFIYERD